MKAAQWYLRVVSVTLFIFGLLYLFMPETMAAITGFTVNASGLADIRATYGGIQIGVAIYLFWGSQRVERYQSAILSITLILFAVFLSRVFGVVIESVINGFHIGGLAFELITSGIGLALYRQLQ